MLNAMLEFPFLPGLHCILSLLGAMVTRESRRNRKRSTALADFYIEGTSTSPDAHALPAQLSPGTRVHTRISQASPASARRKVDRLRWIRRRREQPRRRRAAALQEQLNRQLDDAYQPAVTTGGSQQQEALPYVAPHDAGSRSSSCQFCKAKLWKAEEGTGMLCCR